MPQPVLGILTLYLNENGMLEERDIYRKMTIAGRKLGLDIIIFTPQDVNYKQNRIHALIYNEASKKWSRKWTAFPHMIFDRCRIQRTYRFDQLLQFRSRYSHLNFLNRPLRNKWTIHRTLMKDSRFKSYLPAAHIAENAQVVSEMLRKHPLIYLKPINGTGGRGILRIERKKSGNLLIQGRDQARRIISPQKINSASLSGYLSAWDLKGTRYIAQQGIHLKLPSGRVHDYRMLVQKNGEGVWSVTGCAGRVGPAGSVTSNLHGGGHAVPMTELLQQWVSDASLVKEIEVDAEQFSINVAKHLEQVYGRLCELALDLAIDRKGQIWLLEVNPKPAREVFAQAGEKEAYHQAIIKPLEYALWLYRQKRNGKAKNTNNNNNSSLTNMDALSKSTIDSA
ncbi:Glutathione synthase/RimK-type ligase, ATP-grasp superfamily [Paenibacillus algorifonticola]|uniref:Glutathione synthase/RimK-type ligase, ATP-grasp superfamily n=1 Tax=Paenibacillus algorifonticola TaxID=684063 RepID=A0A1I2B812_9BACL|nr:YheC/YheD family protein [Paenibacillus algorifonticola]SFE51290.1 Glutathione synthase/RimK-type ligase, ATP-grasp superfamily [Paenibacillus algorifonticola]